MKKFYASLTGPLLGLYYPLPFEDDIANRVALNTSKLKSLWCTIYTATETRDCIKRFGGEMLPDDFVGKLDYDSYEVEKVCQEAVA